LRPRSQWPIVLRVGRCFELLSTDFFFRKGLLWETSLSLVSESSLLLSSLGAVLASMCYVMSYAPS
jgi:hypothetical protein